MNRDLIYPGQIALAENMLDSFKDAMVGIGANSEAMLGQGTTAYGLACTALASGVVSGSAFAVQIGRGFMFSYQETDPNAYGVLGADTATNILKTGINLGTTNLGLTNAAPATTGYSVNYLVSAAFQEADTGSTVLPYVNAANPASPYAGPSNSGVSQNTLRAQTVVFQVTAGTAAATGTQTTPATPSGYVPLYVVTVTNAQTAVAGGNIAIAPAAPFLRGNMTQMVPGFGTPVQFTSTGTQSFLVPPGVYMIRGEVWGGGGAGGGDTVAGAGGSGGGGGGYALGMIPVTPGETLTVVVGAGGAGSQTGNGAGGGTSSIKRGSTVLLQATGGTGGYYSGGGGTTSTGTPGVGTLGAINRSGGGAGNGQAYGTSALGGFGGSGGNGNGQGGPSNGAAGQAPGGGGAGGINDISPGGNGGAGEVDIWY